MLAGTHPLAPGEAAALRPADPGRPLHPHCLHQTSLARPGACPTLGLGAVSSVRSSSSVSSEYTNARRSRTATILQCAYERQQHGHPSILSVSAHGSQPHTLEYP